MHSFNCATLPVFSITVQAVSLALIKTGNVQNTHRLSNSISSNVCDVLHAWFSMAGKRETRRLEAMWRHLQSMLVTVKEFSQWNITRAVYSSL